MIFSKVSYFYQKINISMGIGMGMVWVWIRVCDTT